MRDTNGDVLRPGAKVKLTHPDPSYSLGRNNPKTGTKWECEGTYDGGDHVQWDNGSSNSYKSGELSAADGCISIWTTDW